MDEKDVVVTYETLFELLRLEKSREELQKLEDSFFDDVRSYLMDKRNAFESQESQSILFAADEKEKTRLELENIKKILKDLYDRREKKIVNIALNKARTGVTVVNTANMLPSEKLLFDSINTTLLEFRKNILFRLACGEVPEIDSLPETIISKLNCGSFSGSAPSSAIPGSMVSSGQECVSEEPEDSGGLHFRTSDQPKELKTASSLSDSSADLKRVRFLAPIGEIVGPDLKIYGPYDEGAVISLPVDLARVLVEKKQAEEVLS